MSTKMSTNGQARKSLADQIDRLDAMLDGLAEGLNDAVADAVKAAVGAAVQQAVQAVLHEVIANPEVLARFLPVASAAAAPATPKPAKVSWKARFALAYRATAARLTNASAACARRWSLAQEQAGLAWKRARVLGRFKYQLLTAVGVGATAGAAAYFAGPWLAAATGAMGGFAVTLAVQAGLTLKRLMEQAAGSAV